MQMAKDAALGVHWLHSKCNIVHLDLKSANLLLDHNMRVKVTDFGFATIKDSLAADKAKKGTRMEHETIAHNLIILQHYGWRQRL